MVKEDYSSMGKRKRLQYMASMAALYGNSDALQECQKNAIGGTKEARKPKTSAMPPKESYEAMALFKWAESHPRIRGLLVHIPNEGHRTPQGGQKLRMMGMRAGVSDYFLPYPMAPFHGLFIELKRIKGSRTTPEQLAWLDKMRCQGYAACLAFGWQHARRIIEQYIG